MSKVIYLLARKLERINGGYHYDPCVIPSNDNLTSFKMITDDNLVKLQMENEDMIAMFNQITTTLIVPIPEYVYNQLNDSLSTIVEDINQKVDDALEQIKRAYSIMGVEANENELRADMMSKMNNMGESGLVLDENMTLVKRDEEYVIEEYSDEYDEDECDVYEEFDEDDYSYDGYNEDSDYEEDND